MRNNIIFSVGYQLRFHYRSLENNRFDAPDVQVKLHLCTLSYIFIVSDLRLDREFNSRLELRTFSVLQIFVTAFCVQPDHFDSEKIKQTNQRQQQLQLTTAEAA